MEKKTPVQRFWGLLKPDKKEIKNVYIYAVFNGLVMLTLPLGIQSIINHIQGGQINFAWGVLVGFVLLGVALSGTSCLCEWWGGWASWWLGVQA